MVSADGRGERSRRSVRDHCRSPSRTGLLDSLERAIDISSRAVWLWCVVNVDARCPEINVPHPRLNRPHRCAGRREFGPKCMPQVVEPSPLQSCAVGRSNESLPELRRVVQLSRAWMGEDEVVPAAEQAPVAVGRECFRDASCERNRAARSVRLQRADSAV